MMKLILSGVAFATLTVGPALAADMVVRPIDRPPPSLFTSFFSLWQRTPVETAHTRRPAATRTERANRTVRTPVADQCVPAEPKKQYWATSLNGAVDSGLMQGLQESVARGEVGWLDLNSEFPVPEIAPRTNLVLYHVGGNCYAGSDCARFPSSKPIGDRWGRREREVDLNDPEARKIVVADLMGLVRKADELAANGATIGVHLDNVDRLDAEGLARLFNDYLRAVETAKQEGLVSKTRTVGYVAKNNVEGFKQALDRKLLRVAPLYQIVENATLSQDGRLDDNSRIAQDIGRRYRIPVFLKTFGTDVAYTIERGGNPANVYVSQDMTRQMAQMPDISGAAWSPDEARYQPTLFVQGAPVRGLGCEKVAEGKPPAAHAMRRLTAGREVARRLR